MRPCAPVPRPPIWKTLPSCLESNLPPFPSLMCEALVLAANVRPDRRGAKDVGMQTGRAIPPPLQAARYAIWWSCSPLTLAAQPGTQRDQGDANDQNPCEKKQTLAYRVVA